LISILFKNKSILITILASILIIQIIAAPKLCIDLSINGALLFFYKVFPSLFPFLVISNVILAYDGVYIYSRIFGGLLCKPLRLPEECSFVLIISMLCGYPLGAKYSSDLYERKIIDLNTYTRLINIASNPSPLFVVGSVGTSMLNNTMLGYMLLFSCYASCFLLSLVLPRKNKHKKSSARAKHNFVSENIGYVLKNSIENALNTSMSVGGFVIIFSVINGFLSRVIADDSIFKNIFLGMIEMTNGCNLMSNTNCEMIVKIAIISFILSFSGLSIISQVYSFTFKYNISMVKYVSLKAIQGMMCSLISILVYRLYMDNLNISVANIEIHMFNINEFLFVSLIFILVLPFLMYKLINLFKLF